MKFFRYLFYVFLSVGFSVINASAHDTHADATYLANEAIMVTNGEVKVLFDPLFGEGFDTYPMVPAAMRAKIMQGAAPYDGVDAVFVSHVHGDHFAAEDMIIYMQTHKSVYLYAPAQAIDRMRSLQPKDISIFDRAIEFKMEAGGKPIHKSSDNIQVDAVRIPHSGNRWHIENMVFRVTLGANDSVTVMHMGDAAVDDVHFAPYASHWAERQTDHAFPPYWFFGSLKGRKILNERINTKTSTGIHVPINVPRNLRISKFDYFSRPGESRIIPLRTKEPHE